MAQGSHDQSSLAADLEWQFSDDYNDISDVSMDTDIDKFRFLMEGYLHIMEEQADHVPHGIYTSPIRSAKRDGSGLQAPWQRHFTKFWSDSSESLTGESDTTSGLLDIVRSVVLPVCTGATLRMNI